MKTTIEHLQALLDWSQERLADAEAQQDAAPDRDAQFLEIGRGGAYKAMVTVLTEVIDESLKETEGLLETAELMRRGTVLHQNTVQLHNLYADFWLFTRDFFGGSDAEIMKVHPTFGFVFATMLTLNAFVNDAASGKPDESEPSLTNMAKFLEDFKHGMMSADTRNSTQQ